MDMIAPINKFRDGTFSLVAFPFSGTGTASSKFFKDETGNVAGRLAASNLTQWCYTKRMKWRPVFEFLTNSPVFAVFRYLTNRAELLRNDCV
jgi:hypothetical protein